jgi:DNA polymerase zeta
MGILVVEDEGEDQIMLQRRYPDADIRVESSELDVITTVVDIVRDLDPDILTGYEVHSSSWGYLIERSRHLFGIPIKGRLI